jgi:tagaturonate reductase
MAHHETKHSTLPNLNYSLLDAAQTTEYKQMLKYPVKVLQIGEGNFLRAFVDWMIQACNRQGLFEGSIAVTQPRPSGKAKIEELQLQDGLYTLIVRGIRAGMQVEEKEVVTVFSQVLDPYGNWEEFLKLAENPDLDIVLSNTTEAGLAYRPGEWVPGQPIESFPGKLTAFLYRRYTQFAGDPEKGLMLLPCELLERNGDLLKEIVLKHSADWKLPQEFQIWINQHNLFLNSLVDRIATGFPASEAERLFTEWGYEDKLLNTTEPYYLWAIEGSPELDARFPLQQAGLNVHWVDDLRPFQLRKVRILNGAHTLLTSIGLLHGLNEVREAVEHPEFGPRIRKAIMQEIVPSVPLPEAEMKVYAEEVLERFVNPFIQHRLTDIAMNSLSKFKVRLLPTLEAYLEREGKLPHLITEAFASLLLLYRVRKDEDDKFIGSRLNGDSVDLKDDPEALQFLTDSWQQFDRNSITLQELICKILANTRLWGKDLTELTGLTESLRDTMTNLRGNLQ